MTESPYLRTSDLERAFLDASVLRSRYTSAVLLSLADQDIFEPRWTQRVVDELRRTGVPDQRIARMNQAFERAMIEPPPRGLHDEVRATPKYQHVLAGAVQSKSQVLVTGSRTEFDPPSTGPYAMRVEGVNQFLNRKLEEDPHRVLDGLQTVLAGSGRERATLATLIIAPDGEHELRSFAEKLNAAQAEVLSGGT
ncbi:PIN domain-containing protein [Kribbella sp. NPDC049584]|uniref:PIN domain-containing protein n=1 Tax=Kribbella sp. NPDC049584 TaxID=3154833 RepID=UPI0034225366